ncbi:hypothetical protein B0T11DRAFT_276148 [Plectosphaerella cucumerina]|uniref:Uncharacterized protein n=1 Tax=Plectosphaerella cucumerina TaxID=40658 RepID=A0A8K0X635_9PEZI|nr:hypothetical protein B0T11DRAFT_276148 [Plectosphaerella cucumerina]
MKTEKTLGHGDFMRQTSKNGDAPSAAFQSQDPFATAAHTAQNASEYDSPVTFSNYVGQLSASGVSSDEIPIARPYTKTQTHSDKWWARFKVILELTSIANALSAMSMAAVVAGGGTKRNSISAFIVPPAFATIVWNLAELARLLLSPGDSITAGAHVGVRLLLWLVWVPVAIAFPLSEEMRWYDSSIYHSPVTPFVVLGYLIVVLCVTAALLEFTLFVRACIEENRRLKRTRRSKY